MKRLFLILLLSLIVMTACAPDPRKEAQAYQIREQADQDQLNQEANRLHAEQLFQLEKQQKELEYGRQVAIEQTKRNGLNMLWQVVFVMLTAAAVFMIFYSARVYQYTIQGMAQAAVQAAEIKSRLIYLDPKTGQYPLLYAGHGKFEFLDPNIVWPQLDTSKPGDRELIKQLIDGAVSIRHTGVLAQYAARSREPAGVSVIVPPRQFRQAIDVSDDPQAAGDDESVVRSASPKDKEPVPDDELWQELKNWMEKDRQQ